MDIQIGKKYRVKSLESINNTPSITYAKWYNQEYYWFIDNGRMNSAIERKTFGGIVTLIGRYNENILSITDTINSTNANTDCFEELYEG